MKKGINFKMANTLFRVSFAVLCSRMATVQLTSKRPPHTHGEKVQKRAARFVTRNYTFEEGSMSCRVEVGNPPGKEEG